MKATRSSFSRGQVLFLAVLGLLVVDVSWRLIGHWGEVTLHANQMPLRKAIAEIERQGHVRLHTNLDPDTPVTMDVDAVPAAEAIDTLSIVTDSRWRLAYLMGPQRADILSTLRTWETGQPTDGWRWIDRPMMGMMGVPAASTDSVEDPRGEKVELQPEGATELQPLLEKVALLADAEAVLPSDWNPAVGAVTATAPVGGVMTKLAHAGKGTLYETFLLSRPERRQRQAGNDGPPQDGPPPGSFRNDPDQMAKAMQARINRLPSGQRAAAQSQFDEMKAFWASLQGLSPQDRRARIDAKMQSPAFQDAMDDRRADREAKMTPDQRDSRFQHYLSNKAAVKGS